MGIFNSLNADDECEMSGRNASILIAFTFRPSSHI